MCGMMLEAQVTLCACAVGSMTMTEANIVEVIEYLRNSRKFCPDENWAGPLAAAFEQVKRRHIPRT